jgi:toxin ParE1/3/4
MGLDVLLAREAERDIEDIWRYVAEQDSPEKADRLLAHLEELILGLAGLAERGNVPKELLALGIGEFREVHFKPYRVIYRHREGQVTVLCVLDGRRDMQSLMERRLLR